MQQYWNLSALKTTKTRLHLMTQVSYTISCACWVSRHPGAPQKHVAKKPCRLVKVHGCTYFGSYLNGKSASASHVVDLCGRSDSSIQDPPSIDQKLFLHKIILLPTQIYKLQMAPLPDVKHSGLVALALNPIQRHT